MPIITVSVDGSKASVEVGLSSSVQTRPFSSTSPFNTPIPTNPVLDSHSSEMVSLLAAQNAVANLYEFGTPVFTATASTPTQPVKVVDQWAGNFGNNRLIPIPSSVEASIGSDASCVILDPAKGVAYDFWQLSHSSTGWSCSYGTMFSLTGDGCPGFGATGSNIPLLACLTRAYEIEQGKIEHALSIATSHTANTFRFPAFKTDGKGTYPPALPEGTRVQLDPTIDINALTGITPAEKTIGRALQTYGAIIRNSSGSPFSIGFESVGNPTSSTNPYNKAGMTFDYFSIRLPWSKLRVLAKSDGT